MIKTEFIDDVVNAITDTINDTTCEDDAKKVVKTLILMYTNIVTLKYELYKKIPDVRDYQTEINTIMKKPITPINF